MRMSVEVHRALHSRFEKADREEFLAMLLAGKNRVQGFNVVSGR
jgi:hypothetical protein